MTWLKTRSIARIVLDVDGRTVEIDARPSDSIALALRTQSAIFVTERVLEEAGIRPSDEENKSDDEDLTVFRDFVNSLGKNESAPPDLPGGQATS